MKKIKISIIIPIYNQQENINKSLYHFNKDCEILLINDGSTDKSGIICSRLAKRHKNIRYFEQENKGVSAARNLGLKHAQGKYIFFLDADDKLEKGTIENVCDFFDSVYDEVDLVTYPIETIYKGKVQPPHFRYKYLDKTGVYDLRQHPFIGQTTMNIVVKNKFEDNILFDETMSFSEDQKYCCEVLRDKLKMGFCAEGKYIYYRSQNSSSGRMSGACFIFEQCMKMFEDIFGGYSAAEQVPAAFQGLFVNDIYWKMVSNILFPYHYEEAAYRKAIDRIVALLGRCDNRVILEHPSIDYFEKYYLLRLKDKNALRLRVFPEKYFLYNDDTAVLTDNKMELVMTSFRIEGTRVRIAGFLKNVAFHFYDKKPILCAVENDGKLTRVLSVFPSAHCYYRAHEATQKFWAFHYELDVREVQKVRFEAEMGGFWYPIKYYFMPRVPFSNFNKSYVYTDRQVEARVCEDSSISFQLRTDAGCYERIWIYYDCRGVLYDNGMQQFNHDVKIDDGIIRYYIVSDERQRKYAEALPERLVSFGSGHHKELLCRADKILTAYIEENNIFPYGKDEIEKISSQFHFEVIYLQHGVLHIRMPWKFSPEKIIADRVVTSTRQETELFVENGFREQDIIKTGMPRFDKKNRKPYESRNRLKKRILFAPSWRIYLVGDCVGNVWQMLDRKFLESTYYKKIVAFLNSLVLQEILKRNECVLEVKLHPIFSKYSGYIEKYVNSKEIVFIEKVENAGDYDLFVTDFSSYLYDFLMENIHVLNFIPDIDEFRCGMNGYRDLNYPKEFWKSVSTEPEQIVNAIGQFMESGKCEPIEADFYELDYAMDYIYQALIQSDSNIEAVKL